VAGQFWNGSVQEIVGSNLSLDVFNVFLLETFLGNRSGI
jgi:hypothetical protein